MLLGPDLQFARNAIRRQGLARQLRHAGLDTVFCGEFTLAGERMRVGYSSPLARELLIEPAAWI